MEKKEMKKRKMAEELLTSGGARDASTSLS